MEISEFQNSTFGRNKAAYRADKRFFGMGRAVTSDRENDPKNVQQSRGFMNDFEGKDDDI